MGSFSPGLAIGFHSPSTERSTLEHDIVEWVIDNDVLGLLLLAQDSDSIQAASCASNQTQKKGQRDQTVSTST
jgi:hypothetical protein